MKFGIVVFPGSNCERDCHDAVTQYLQEQAVYLWHADPDLQGVNCILLPGGFSYGDYLRSGAIARFSPIMQSVRAFAEAGRPVLGICNGFQVLTEARLLPGSLTKNQSLQFQCDRVQLRVENTQSPFTTAYETGSLIELPIAHAEGNFYAEPDDIKRLEDNQQVLFRYVENVNGSINNIAGICNAQRNVVGMMPHPERNLWQTETWSGEGAPLFQSIKQSLSTLLGAV